MTDAREVKKNKTLHFLIHHNNNIYLIKGSNNIFYVYLQRSSFSKMLFGEPVYNLKMLYKFKKKVV